MNICSIMKFSLVIAVLACSFALYASCEDAGKECVSFLVGYND